MINGLIVGKTGIIFFSIRYLEKLVICTAEMTAAYKKTTLATILSSYKLNEIHNIDEFGLFFCMQPNKLLNLGLEACIGEKHSKILFTGMTDANAAGDKIYICHR